MRAELADGRILEFPDGTDPSVIRATVKKVLAAQPAPESNLLETVGDAVINNPVTRGLGEFGSAIQRGAADTVDFFVSNPINAALQLGGSEARVPTVRQPNQFQEGNFIEDGLPKQIIRAGGELVAPALTGGAALRTAAAAIPEIQASQTLGSAITKQLGASAPAQDIAAAALAGAGGELGQEVAGETGKAVGTLVAPIAPAALKSAASTAIKTILRGVEGNTKGMNKVIDDFSEVGEVPTISQATGRTGQQVVENISGRVAGGGKIVSKAEKLSDSIKERVSRIADDISLVEGAESAGLTIKKGITGRGGFIDRFLSKSSKLWNKSDSFIDDSATVSVANIKGKLDELVREGKIGQILDNPKLSQIKAVLDDVDSLDYRTLRDLRSAVGQKLGNKELITDIPRAELKQVYGALSEDIRQAASQQGDEALKAFNRANAFTRSGHNRLDDFVERITRNVEVDKIFNAVTKGGEGTKVINTFKKSLRPEEWEIVVSNVIRKLGAANAGQQNATGDAFSVGKFLTDWNKLGTAKNSLLSGTKKLETYRNSLNKIARVAERVKEAQKQGANPSGTGQFNANFGLATTGIGGTAGALAAGNPAVATGVAATVLSTIAMNNVGARLMTNPLFVKWLATNATTPKLTGAQITALAKVASASNLDDAAAIQTLIEEIEQ